MMTLTNSGVVPQFDGLLADHDPAAGVHAPLDADRSGGQGGLPLPTIRMALCRQVRK